MKKTALLKALNPLLALLILDQIATIIAFNAGFHSHMLQEIHELNGYGIFAAAALHLWLNFGWVKSTYLKKKPKTSVQAAQE